MRFVSIKSAEQQNIQSLHRYRQRVVEERTALANQIRGLLTEYGIIIPQGIGFLRKKLPEILEEERKEFTPLSREIFNQLYEDLKAVDQKIKNLDKRIKSLCQQSENCQRLTQKIGYLTATALASTIGDVSVFKKWSYCLCTSCQTNRV